MPTSIALLSDFSVFFFQYSCPSILNKQLLPLIFVIAIFALMQPFSVILNLQGYTVKTP